MNIYDGRKKPAQKNDTGIPDKLKQSLEAKYSIPLDDVRVHMKSSKPDALDALAYTQGRNVYIGPGQEQHLPHELGHVMQQKMKKVQGSYQKKVISINDDSQLEKEATTMGKAAVQTAEGGDDTNIGSQHAVTAASSGDSAVQMMAKETAGLRAKAEAKSAGSTHERHMLQGEKITKSGLEKFREDSTESVYQKMLVQTENRVIGSKEYKAIEKDEKLSGEQKAEKIAQL